MKQYIQLVSDVLNYGEEKNDRTGTGTISYFGYQMRFDLQQGFPLLTTKKMAIRAIIAELLWFLEGSTDERRLCELTHGTRDLSKKTIWTDNAQAPYWIDNALFDGDCGEIYGHQWRSFGIGDVDQIKTVLHQIKHDPNSRRILVTAYDPNSLDRQALPPCHTIFQFNVRNGFLDCQLYQR